MNPKLRQRNRRQYADATTFVISLKSFQHAENAFPLFLVHLVHQGLRCQTFQVIMVPSDRFVRAIFLMDAEFVWQTSPKVVPDILLVLDCGVFSEAGKTFSAGSH